MTHYVGRFAPTPSGPLHAGSLVAALGSYLDARAHGGQWLLRIDDLDATRIVPAAESTIYRQLEAHGLLWDGTPYRQSEHIETYEAALEALTGQGLIYGCRCTRAELKEHASADGEVVYPGTCRNAMHSGTDCALRFQVSRAGLTLEDDIQGKLHCLPEQALGDFVVRRKDGLVAYQLACAVDEAAMDITDVLRGVDLLASTFRQRLLMQALALNSPQYAHLPLMRDAEGRKLSKQNHAIALDLDTASTNLVLALRALGQPAVAGGERMPVAELLHHAVAAWRREAVPRDRNVAA